MRIEMVINGDRPYYLVPIVFTPAGPRTGAPPGPNPWRAVFLSFEEALQICDFDRDGSEILVKVIELPQAFYLGVLNAFHRQGDHLFNFSTGEYTPLSTMSRKIEESLN